MKYSAILLLSLILISCGGDSGSNAPAASKSIFSQWTRNDNLLSFDLTGQSFSTAFNMQFLLSTGELCQCVCFLIGSESSGTISVSNCTYQGGGSGDPNCPNLWENGGDPYDYTKSGVTLTLCDDPNVDCGTYN